MKKCFIFIVSLAYSLIYISSPVFAVDERFYSSNDILFYNSDDIGCAVDEGSNSDSVIVSSENARTILEFFTGKGFSLAAASGIVGNLNAESSLNPAVAEGGKVVGADYNPVNGSSGFGLAQWTTIDRQRGLVEFAKSQNAKITDISMQLGYIWKEMGSSEYDYMISKMNANKSDPAAAAVVFHGLTPNIEGEGGGIHPTFSAAQPKYGYERSGDTSAEVVKNRGGVAKAIYDKYKGSIKDGAGVKLASGAGSESSASPADCDSEATTNSLSSGVGSFTDTGQVKGFDNVLHNSQLSDKAFGTSLVGDGICAAIVSRVWRGQNIGYGSSTPPNNGYANQMWVVAGPKVGHPDRKPKAGAILIYNSSNAAGHVVIYLGKNKILNDGHIENADVEKRWNLKYLGWIDPNDVGWSSHKTNNIHNAVGR